MTDTIESQIVRALEGYSDSSSHDEQARSLLLAGALMPLTPNIYDLPVPHSLLGLAWAAEQAQWNMIFDIANSAYQAQLQELRVRLGKEKLVVEDVIPVLIADKERPAGEKAIWDDEQYCKFIEDLMNAEGTVHATKSAKHVQAYVYGANDPLLAKHLWRGFDKPLNEAIYLSAYLRIYLLMHQGRFMTDTQSYIMPDSFEIIKMPLIMKVCTLVLPVADEEYQSRLIGWDCDEAYMPMKHS